MRILTLLENTTSDTALIHKHGLCLYIETGCKKILIDTGPDQSFIKNAEHLNIDLSRVDLVFLSHGHYDHGGGIPAFQKINKTARIILSQAAMNPFYARLPLGLSKYIGLPKDKMDIAQCDFISQDQQIDEDIHIFTRFGQTGFIPLGNQRLLAKSSQGKKTVDDFSHEMAVLISEDDTQVLFTGCSHSGVGNVVQSVLNRTGLERIDTVIGGFHLFNPINRKTESLERLQQLATELGIWPDTKFYTGHCTGKEAFDHLKELMQDRIFGLTTGAEIRI